MIPRTPLTIQPYHHQKIHCLFKIQRIIWLPPPIPLLKNLWKSPALFSMWNSFNVTAHRAAGVSLWHVFSGSVYLRIKSNSFQLFHNYFSQLYWIHNCGLLSLFYIKPLYGITIPYYFKLFHNYFVTIANYWNL